MWDARAPALGEQAPDLTLLDEMGRQVSLSSLAGPLLVLVFRSATDEASLHLLRDYRDCTVALFREGLALCGVAQAEPSALSFLRSERGLGFPLLADPCGAQLAKWAVCDSNAVFLLDHELRVLQRADDERAPAEAMLGSVRRSRRAEHQPALLARVANYLQAVRYGLRPRHLAR
jgi:peroxiredoxin